MTVSLVELVRRLCKEEPALLARAGQLDIATRGLRDPYDQIPADWLQEEPRRGWITLGRARKGNGDPCFVAMPMADFIGRSSWVVGASGGGKSYLVLAALLSIWVQDACNSVLVDMKNELVDLALEARRGLVGMGLLAATPPVVIDPFGDQAAPLGLTLPQEGVDPRVQALNIATALQEMLASDFSFGTSRVLLKLVPLLIEGRHPLTRVSRWLQAPVEFQRDAMRSQDPSIRDYALRHFPKENQSSLRALGGRLDMLLYLPQVRAALESPSCFDPAEALKTGNTYVKLGNAPAGCEPAQQLFASLLVGAITRAILSRPIREGVRPTLIVLDEVQEALRSQDKESRHLERVLSLARFRSCSLLLCNQNAGQLDRRLVEVIGTNTANQFAFRSNAADAHVLSRVLPTNQASDDSPADARRRTTRELVHLRDREYFLWAKRTGIAIKLRSPRIDMTAFRAHGARVHFKSPPPPPATGVKVVPKVSDQNRVIPAKNFSAGADDEFPALG